MDEKKTEKLFDQVLVLNLEAPDDGGVLYEREYRFNKETYKILVCKSGVIVHRYTESEEAIWDFSGYITKEVQDAFRKAYILYALCVGKGLIIKTITVMRGEEVLRSIRAKDDEAFPYVFSMLGGHVLTRKHDVPGEAGVFENPKILNFFTKSIRSEAQNDKRMIALYAFLQGRSREFEADRFLNYWTAINSIYCYLIEEHESRIRKKFAEIKDTEWRYYNIEQWDLEALYTLFNEKYDYRQISVFLDLIREEKGIKFKRANNKTAELLKFYNDYSNRYRCFAEDYKDEDGHIRFSFERLYDLILENKPIDELEFRNEDEKEAYCGLEDWSNKIGSTLYTLLSIDVPYFMRNYYIHGSETALLVSDTYHLDMLSCLNYFMDRLLVEYIPCLFDEHKLKTLIDKVHAIIYQKREKRSTKKDEDNKKNKEKKEEPKIYDNPKTVKAVNAMRRNKKGCPSWLIGGQLK